MVSLSLTATGGEGSPIFFLLDQKIKNKVTAQTLTPLDLPQVRLFYFMDPEAHS